MRGDQLSIAVQSIGHITQVRVHQWEPPAWNTPAKSTVEQHRPRRKRVNKTQSPINQAIIAALTGSEGKFLSDIRAECQLVKTSCEQAVIRLEKAGIIVSESRLRNASSLSRAAKFCRMVAK